MVQFPCLAWPFHMLDSMLLLRYGQHRYNDSFIPSIVLPSLFVRFLRPDDSNICTRMDASSVVGGRHRSEPMDASAISWFSCSLAVRPRDINTVGWRTGVKLDPDLNVFLTKSGLYRPLTSTSSYDNCRFGVCMLTGGWVCIL